MAANEKTNTEIMKEKFADKEMSMEQLENVAGGVIKELSEDSQFLNTLLQGRPGQCKRYSVKECRGFFYNHDVEEEVNKAWDSIGITYKFSFNASESSYFRKDNGRKLTREEAMTYAQDVVGKHMSSAEWCY